MSPIGTAHQRAGGKLLGARSSNTGHYILTERTPITRLGYQLKAQPMFNLKAPVYNDEAAARKHLEGIRWEKGAYCPHCGEAEQVYEIGGKSAERGLWACRSCRRKFTVTVGTVFERSHIGLTKWLAAFDLMCSSKKGIRAHQIHRMLGITYKSAWFMCHRIRTAMDKGGVTAALLGGKGKHVEADETYIGRKGITGKRLMYQQTHQRRGSRPPAAVAG